MTLVGTRPEVPQYVASYSPEMMATLLLPAGVTSRASIEFKDEATFLSGADDVDGTYIREVLPVKMRINLQDLKMPGIRRDMITMLTTVSEVFCRRKA